MSAGRTVGDVYAAGPGGEEYLSTSFKKHVLFTNSLHLNQVISQLITSFFIFLSVQQWPLIHLRSHLYVSDYSL